MKYGSVCSGIEAATVAWHGLGWKPQWFSEIEAFTVQNNDGGAHKRKDRPNGGLYVKETDTSLTVGSTDMTAVKHGMAVRRLTPRECERLQGFPDDWMLIPWKKGVSTDGHRYKALGNSWAVPCAKWIGKRIQMVEEIINAH